MGLLSFLNPWRKAAPPDYETILSRLSTEIAEAKTNLSEIKLRERRYMLLLNAYSVLLWVIWTGLWWLNGLPWGLVGLRAEEALAKAIGSGLTLLSPLGLIALNRLLHYVYTVQRGKEENHLRVLLTKQHGYIEDIKKSNNFYKTKDLIERYDAEGPSAVRGSPAVQGRGPRGVAQDSPSPASRAPQTPQMGKQMQSSPTTTAGGLVTPLPPQPENPLSPQQVQQLRLLQQSQMQPVLPTPQKKWYDHVADKLMGEDPSQAAHTKYALVCGGCFRHNGLVGGGKEEWERTQWICPRCNYFNPAPRSRSPTTDAEQSASTGVRLPSNPSAPLPSPSTPHSTPSKLRQRGTAGGSSRLGTQVISAADVDGDDDRMEVDDDGR